MMRIKYIIPLIISIFLCGCQSTEEASEPVVCTLEWYQPANSYDTSNVDVLYLVSTEVLSAKDSAGNISWTSQLVDADKTAIKGEMAWVEENMFGKDFNLVSPYYHQFSFDAICKLPKEKYDSVYSCVAKEVCNAFDYYMKYQNNGRPYILAGFSQGAMLCQSLLKHMTDEQYSRMIACYSLGYRLTKDDLSHPHIKAAEGETDKGVVISFNSSQTKESIWSLVSEGAATCINPVNWKTDSTPASFVFDGIHNVVHVDKETNTLIVDSESPEYFQSWMDEVKIFYQAGASRDNLHHWDLMFYPRYIHENAVKRASSQR